MYALGMVVFYPLLPLKKLEGTKLELIVFKLPAVNPFPAAAFAGDSSMLVINANRFKGVEFELLTGPVFRK
jgi:hypothetical protein